MKDKLNVLVIFVAAWVLIGGFSGWAYGASAEITLRYAGDLPIGNHLTRGQEFFAKRVDEISKGRIKVAVYPAGQLYSVKDYPRVVPSGALDMAQCSYDKWSGLVPVSTILSLPFLFNSWSHVWAFTDSEGGEIMKKEMEKVGIKQLFWMQDASLGFVSKKPLHKIEDFKGVRVRSPDETNSWTIQALGGVPTFLAGGEVYMALQRGTVDAAVSSVTSFVDRKFFEVTKYFTETNYVYGMYLCMINFKKWNELPVDVKEILATAGRETQEWGRKEIVKMEVDARDTLRKKMEAYVLPTAERDRWKQASESVYETCIQKTGDIGKKLIKLAEDAR